MPGVWVIFIGQLLDLLMGFYLVILAAVYSARTITVPGHCPSRHRYESGVGNQIREYSVHNMKNPKHAKAG